MAALTETSSGSSLKEEPSGVTAPLGYVAAGVHCGVKRYKKDLCLLFSERPAHAAGTFTTNRVKAAPLLVTQEHIKSGPVRAVVVNSGVANACNGPQGLEDAHRMASLAAGALSIRKEEVLVASTGVIGELLPMDKIEAGIAKAAKALRRGGASDAALAIMTTDTRPKEVALTFRAGGREYTVGGMAKGSGMIHPNMATMLAFLTTDAPVEREFLAEVLKAAVDRSFNLVSVDGDTSTNDMAILLANGAAGGEAITRGSEGAGAFAEAVEAACVALAKMIAADGEGATKLIEIRVSGAATEHDARLVVRSIARSPLVKTAVAGEDPNWGRVLCATGYSGAWFDPEKVRVKLGAVTVYDGGRPTGYEEAAAKKALEGREVVISVDLGAGSSSAVGWTCDLTYDYVKINAAYRT